MPGVVRHRADEAAAEGGRRAEPRHRRHRPRCATGHDRRGPTPATCRRPGRPRSSGSSPTTSASRRTILRTSSALATRRGRAGVHIGRRGAGPRARRRVPLERPRRPGGRSTGCRRHHRRGLLGDGAGLRHLPRPPAARPPPSAAAPTSSRSATTAATTRCADLRDGQGRDHQPEPQLRGRPDGSLDRAEVTHRQPQRRRRRGHPRASTCRRSRSSTTPRPGPAPTTPPTCSSTSPSSCGRATGATERNALMPQRADISLDPADRLGPDRHRPGLRVRLLGHPGVPGVLREEGYRVDPGQLEPGHDHDRSRLRRRAPTSSRSTSEVLERDHRGRAAATPCCRRSAARPR